MQALVCAFVFVGAPVLAYAFFFRLARLRHRKRPEKAEALRDLSAREFEMLLARALPQPPQAADAADKDGLM